MGQFTIGEKLVHVQSPKSATKESTPKNTGVLVTQFPVIRPRDFFLKIQVFIVRISIQRLGFKNGQK